MPSAMSLPRGKNNGFTTTRRSRRRPRNSNASTANTSSPALRSTGVSSCAKKESLMSTVLEAQRAMPAVHRLGWRALSLGAANGFEYASPFLLPLVLARCLAAAAFGPYRVLWLRVGTGMARRTLAILGSHYYVLPRS